MEVINGIVETARHGGLDNIKQKAWESGFSDGAQQLYNDIDKILQDAASGPHWGALVGTGVMGKIKDLRSFYKVDGRMGSDVL